LNELLLMSDVETACVTWFLLAASREVGNHISSVHMLCRSAPLLNVASMEGEVLKFPCPAALSDEDSGELLDLAAQVRAAGAVFGRICSVHTAQ
jgi:hypothetical protein